MPGESLPPASMLSPLAVVFPGLRERRKRGSRYDGFAAQVVYL